VAGCPAVAPCRQHTVPKRVGKTTLFGMLEDGAVTSGGYAKEPMRLLEGPTVRIRLPPARNLLLYGEIKGRFIIAKGTSSATHFDDCVSFEGPKGVEPCCSTSVPRMTGTGASRPLPRVRAKVP